jgi:precorrin-2 dehydrogenase/sirohydrochlorin ferrochelatase
VPVDAPLFPVNLLVEGRRCLVVGGGAVAAQKARELAVARADLVVVAPEVGDAVRAVPGATIVERGYQASDLDGCWLVITATDDPAVNRQVRVDADARGIWVNSADDLENCSFTLPARVRRGPLLVTVSTGGHSPAMATWLRRRFETELGPEYETLLGILDEVRTSIREAGRPTEGLDWQSALDSGMLELVREGRLAEAKERLETCLSSPSA